MDVHFDPRMGPGAAGEPVVVMTMTIREAEAMAALTGRIVGSQGMLGGTYQRIMEVLDRHCGDEDGLPSVDVQDRGPNRWKPCPGVRVKP